MIERDPDNPLFVTFTTGAELLVRLGIDSEATAQGLRHMARNADDWPFGDGEGQLPYMEAGQARTMETGKFLAYFREHPRTGRGRDKAPRRKRGEAQ